jgi:hypothetical protein
MPQQNEARRKSHDTRNPDNLGYADGRRRFIRSHSDRDACREQRAALSTAGDGSTHRPAKAAGRADHESVSVGLGGPYNPLLRSPVLGQRMFDLLHYLRWETSVPLKLNEFAILIIGRQWRSQVEWFAHAPLAIKAGLRRRAQGRQAPVEHVS